MIELKRHQAQKIKHWFLPEQPGPLVGMHVVNTGRGAIFADRWPDPSVVLSQAGENYALCGDPAGLEVAWLRQQITGFVDAPEQFVAHLWQAFPNLYTWPRVVLQLDAEPPPRRAKGFEVRPISPADVVRIAALSPESGWICRSWSGADGLAESGYAWGAFDGGRLTSVACSFFVGDAYEEVGIVTEPAYRRRGLAAACASALCRVIRDRGRIPSWSTTPDNRASLGLAIRLGFQHQRDDRLYVVGRTVPDPIADREEERG